jgi:hypothetical protein
VRRLAALALFAAPLCALAQSDPRQAIVSTTVSADTVSLGEPFTVRVRVRAPKVATIVFPEVPGAANGVDPVDPRSIEEGPTGDFLDRTAVYSFVAWDVGARAPVFDPVRISIAGREAACGVGATGVFVRSLLPADSSEAPRDSRAPVHIPGNLWQYLLAGGLVFGVILYLIWLRRQKRLEATEDAAPEPWIQAREAFSRLEALQLAESGEPGRHVIAHVDVLRTYIERRFPTVNSTLDAPSAASAMSQVDFPLPVHKVAELLERDASLRFAQSPVAVEEAVTLAAQARDITANLQLAHEARMRAVERPPRPRRR